MSGSKWTGSFFDFYKLVFRQNMDFCKTLTPSSLTLSSCNPLGDRPSEKNIAKSKIKALESYFQLGCENAIRLALCV